MKAYKYTGSSDFYLRAGDEHLAPGDEVTFEDGPPEAFAHNFEAVEAEEAESGAESESEGAADDSPSDEDEAAENGAEAPFNPGTFNVDELEAELAEQDFDTETLDALYAAEESGDDRKGAKAVIDDARGE